MYFVKIAATVDDNCVIMIDKLSDQTVMNIILTCQMRVLHQQLKLMMIEKELNLLVMFYYIQIQKMRKKDY